MTCWGIAAENDSFDRIWHVYIILMQMNVRFSWNLNEQINKQI